MMIIFYVTFSVIFKITDFLKNEKKEINVLPPSISFIPKQKTLHKIVNTVHFGNIREQKEKLDIQH